MSKRVANSKSFFISKRHQSQAQVYMPCIKSGTTDQLYLNTFNRLRFYKGLLTSRISAFSAFSDSEKNLLSPVVSTITRLLSGSYGNFFVFVDEAIKVIQNQMKVILNYSKQSKNLLTQLLVTLQQMSNLFQQIFEASLNAPNIKSETLINEESQYVVCRICNNTVPASLFDFHTEICAQSKSLQSTNSHLDDSLRQYIKQLVIQLDSEWPGEKEESLSFYIPILHITLILKFVLSVHPKSISSTEELDSFYSDFESIFNLLSVSKPVSNPNPTSEPDSSPKGKLLNSKLLSSIRLNLIQKRKCTELMQAAAGLLHQTQIGNSDEIPPSISQFELLKRISSGAFARVYLARHKISGDIFAIKVQAKNAMAKKNFQRLMIEKTICFSIHHPKIVSSYYAILGNNNFYLVMEYLPGGDLYSVLHNIGSLDEDSAKVYTIQVVRALEFLRSVGIVHRDIKPDNLLIDAEGGLKLVDFGLSIHGVSDRRSQEDKAHVGTPNYIAPEICLGHVHSFEVDYWSLGCMVYEFIAGKPPFEGKSLDDLYKSILSGNYEILEDVSPELNDFIARLLCTNPSNRLGSKNIQDILNHPWLKEIDEKTMTPPFVPSLDSPEDTSYFISRRQFENDESDIYADMHGHSSPTPVDFEKDEKKFPEVSVKALIDLNKKLSSRTKSQTPPQTPPSTPFPSTFSPVASFSDVPPALFPSPQLLSTSSSELKKNVAFRPRKPSFASSSKDDMVIPNAPIVDSVKITSKIIV